MESRYAHRGYIPRRRGLFSFFFFPLPGHDGNEAGKKSYESGVRRNSDKVPRGRIVAQEKRSLRYLRLALKRHVVELLLAEAPRRAL